MTVRDGNRPALFLDRDGTIIDDVHYISSPDQVRLRPGAARAIARRNAAGTPVIVVTNQSGIGRGMFTEADYRRVHARMLELLAAEGARVDAEYHCPHHPGAGDACDCRKPGTGMYREAAEALGIDLARSTYVGDRWRDVAPGLALGGTGVLVLSPRTPHEDRALAEIAGVKIVQSGVW